MGDTQMVLLAFVAKVFNAGMKLASSFPSVRIENVVSHEVASFLPTSLHKAWNEDEKAALLFSSYLIFSSKEEP